MRVERGQPERDDAQRDRTTQVATMASSARQVLRGPRRVQTLSNTEAGPGVCKRYPTRKPPITFFVARGCGAAAGDTVAAPREPAVPSAQAMAGTGGAPPQAPPRGRRLLPRCGPSSWLLVLVLVVLVGPVAGRSTATLQLQDRSGHTGAVLKGHIFPLPRSQATSSASHLSRGTRQRVNGELAIAQRVDEVARGLTWMSGRRGESGGPGWSSAQLEVRELAERRIRRRGRPPNTESGEQILHAMTKGRSDYSGTSLGTPVAPYRLSEVSFPDNVKLAPFLRTLCSPKAVEYLSTYSTSMLRPQEEYDALDVDVFVEPYMGPVLRGSRRKYKELVSDLDRRGLIYWSTTCRERCVIFFVKKKSGKLRLIIDAQRANR